MQVVRRALGRGCRGLAAARHRVSQRLPFLLRRWFWAGRPRGQIKEPPVATMAFALNTETHVAQAGDTTLEFQPEVMGDDFMGAYAEMREQQPIGVDISVPANADPAQRRTASRALRGSPAP